MKSSWSTELPWDLFKAISLTHQSKVQVDGPPSVDPVREFECSQSLDLNTDISTQQMGDAIAKLHRFIWWKLGSGAMLWLNMLADDRTKSFSLELAQCKLRSLKFYNAQSLSKICTLKSIV